MYSGSTFNTYSGRILGAHQKIDRLARHHLEQILPKSGFPSAKSIMYFEGDNGPDGIKRKSPGKDEPWHFFLPFDNSDTQLLAIIEDHYNKLIKALRSKDSVRSAFEAAWLAHAIVDGLTPAHHYPFEEKLKELSSGQNINMRTTVVKKLLVPGETLARKLTNNWNVIGPKGLLTTHATFEGGVAMLIAPISGRRTKPTADKIESFLAQPFSVWYRATAQEVARMELYDTYYRTGWTMTLARRVRAQLTPLLVQSVTIAWYGACLEAAKPAKLKGVK